MDFEVTEVDGVTAFVTPHDGPTRMSLLFRVGTADETLPMRGITHLVEHLALYEVTKGDVHANGFTEPSITSFVISGDDEEIVDFYAQVGHALQALPVERFDAEVRVLRTEASQRSPSLMGTHLRLRYGYRGWGLSDAAEIGLEHLGPDVARSWATERFNRQNAVLWVHGTVPADLRLPLPDGQRFALPEVDPLPDRLPMYVNVGPTCVATSLLVPRVPAASMALAVLEDRVGRRLRTEEGRVYGIVGDLVAVGADRVVLYLGADCLEDQLPAVMDGVLGELGTVATLGPDEAELERQRKKMERAKQEPGFAAGGAMGAARSHLAGIEVLDGREWLDQVAAVDAEEVRSLLDLGRDQAYLTLPLGTAPLDRRVLPFEEPERPRISGSGYWRAHRAPDASSDDRLSVDATGISLRFGAGGTHTQLWSECAAVLRYTNGARVVYGLDGGVLLAHPEEWSSGDQVVATIDRVAPAAIAVPMDRPLASAYLESLASQPLPPPPVPPSWAAAGGGALPPLPPVPGPGGIGRPVNPSVMPPPPPPPPQRGRRRR